MKISCILSLFFLMCLCKTACAQLNPPADYTLTKDLVYTKLDNWEGRMDLYLPKKGAKKKPLVIFIHGGGWVHGKKEQETDFAIFFEKNFVVANIEYRIAKQASAPAAIEDSKCALQYLVSNAAKYRIDRKKIVIMGISAGGHLALMTGLTAKDSVFNAECTANSNKDFKVAAIVDYSA